MLNRFKSSWEIEKNWMLLFPVLGIIASLLGGYLISNKLLTTLSPQPSTLWFLPPATLLIGWFIVKICLWCFDKLKYKWNVKYRWEFIPIFIGFAITGSLAARLAKPILTFLGIEQEAIHGLIYWPLRIAIILPIYQVLLLIIGFLVGQFQFFWEFEKKMLRRFGLKL